ncbi:MAG: glucosaminidase domain-containing protein [Azoarcus sp.]|jgi:uncharacterized Zn-binding protein involved in type VI secretion|nr:glucosaminidase domain-containing protein [Azoarcus sp.]
MNEHLMNLFIVEGDTTTRGGKVVNASGLGVRVRGGQRMACIGDEVRYENGKVARITGSGGTRIEIGGKFVAMEGDLVSDGSKLVASTVRNRDTYIGEKKDASEWQAPLYGAGSNCDKPKFFILYNYFKKMADKLNTNADFIMAQAAQESLWAESEAAIKGYNLFGFNRRIDDPRIYRLPDGKHYGTNAVYGSIEEGIQAWVNKWGVKVKGVKTIEEYINKLNEASYNERPEVYKQKILNVHKSVLRRKERCGIPN